MLMNFACDAVRDLGADACLLALNVNVNEEKQPSLHHRLKVIIIICVITRWSSCACVLTSCIVDG